MLERHPLGAGSTRFLFAFGVFWDGAPEGVMTWGGPAVNGAGTALRLRQSEILELRKFWLSDVPPRNSESRCLGVAARIIRKRYPSIRLLLTYCEGDEKASSYKGAGWIRIGESKHANMMTSPDGRRTLTVRDFNRKGGRKVLGPWTPNHVHKSKFVLPLDPKLAAIVQEQHARPPAVRRRCDSDLAAPNL